MVFLEELKSFGDQVGGKKREDLRRIPGDPGLFVKPCCGFSFLEEKMGVGWCFLWHVFSSADFKHVAFVLKR